MIDYKKNILISVFFFFSFAVLGQDNGSLKFQGFFPSDSKNPVFISLKQENSKLTGILKYENRFQTNNLEGYINKENVFKLYELDADGNRTGAIIKGTIKDRQMLADFSDKETAFNFEFAEVYYAGADSTLIHKKRLNEDFVELSLNFKTISDKNQVLKYDDFASAIVIGTSPFLEKEIKKVSSDEAPFTIQERIRYIQKHSYGVKVKFDEGCTGLIVHAYYYSQEGPLFNTYMFIYDEFGDFVQAFVLYEANQMGNPNIETKFSSSQIFSILDFANGLDNPIVFRIDKSGNFEFLDRN